MIIWIKNRHRAFLLYFYQLILTDIFTLHFSCSRHIHERIVILLDTHIVKIANEAWWVGHSCQTHCISFCSHWFSFSVYIYNICVSSKQMPIMPDNFVCKLKDAYICFFLTNLYFYLTYIIKHHDNVNTLEIIIQYTYVYFIRFLVFVYTHRFTVI